MSKDFRKNQLNTSSDNYKIKTKNNLTIDNRQYKIIKNILENKG